MVALSFPTVARGGMSMVARPLLALLVVSGLAHAYSNPGRKYGGDVSGEEVVIDQLQDFLRSRHSELASPPLPPYARPSQSVNDKIHFAVTPKDPRYYLPKAALLRQKAPSEEDLLHLLPPSDLNGFQPQQEYPNDLFQYQEEDEIPYQPEYPHPQSRRYEMGERFPPQFLRVPYPGMELYPDPGMLDLRGTRLMMEGEDVDGGAEDREASEREESKRMMAMEEEEEKKEDEGHQEAMKKDEKKMAVVAAATSQPEAVNYMHLHRTPAEAREASYSAHTTGKQPRLSDLYFTALVAGCTAVAVCGVIGAGVCWYRLNKSHRAAQDAEYPAYGVTGPNKDLSPSSGDRKLAQSAHMYHYQHQKQQMIALEKSAGGERHGSTSDADSEEEGEENEYTVYECPGLAPTGEMEVKNPLFHDDPTPATPSMRKEQEEQEAEEDEEEEVEQKDQ